jgi:hypothetical protein
MLLLPIFPTIMILVMQTMTITSIKRPQQVQSDQNFILKVKKMCDLNLKAPTAK